MACPALPTCGLSLAESERYLPDLLGTVENLLEDNGLGDERVILRMTGCPNGCARPYMAELGFVGKRPSVYALYLGGNEEGTRLSRLYDQNVKVDELPEKLGGLCPLQGRARQQRALRGFLRASCGSSRMQPNFNGGFQ